MIRFFIADAYRVITDRKGVTAAEYAVLATGIVLVVGVAAASLGGRLTTLFGAIAK